LAFSVIPVKAGIQEIQLLLDPGFRRGDDLRDFIRFHQAEIDKESSNLIESLAKAPLNPLFSEAA
jgi:hypothetical protein